MSTLSKYLEETVPQAMEEAGQVQAYYEFWANRAWFKKLNIQVTLLT